MNCLDLKKMLEGCLYNYHLKTRITSDQLMALKRIKDIVRESKIHITANEYGQVVIVQYDDNGNNRREIARASFI